MTRSTPRLLNAIGRRRHAFYTETAGSAQQHVQLKSNSSPVTERRRPGDRSTSPLDTWRSLEFRVVAPRSDESWSR
ncbi:MAG TPA: hypothetical protein VGZ68_09280 [Acidimicrobiales bacterium]|nr:hypothetical protein [Acidimicrobiales bacterium]